MSPRSVRHSTDVLNSTIPKIQLLFSTPKICSSSGVLNKWSTIYPAAKGETWGVIALVILPHSPHPISHHLLCVLPLKYYYYYLSSTVLCPHYHYLNARHPLSFRMLQPIPNKIFMLHGLLCPLLAKPYNLSSKSNFMIEKGHYSYWQ